ncbi:diguanylate cyclase [Sphingomonas sp. SUN039]|uniref:GGDEF domain-containing protein n=1 Tax=Sphingomonas sp. SUN039 TaxID=2937787 RepID=UPI0021649590|nr:diguanylate cyclase [Sphingomonas sp. SUN039]UVO54602.1 GGDEF domain-containing protein [Sphingomonas sp. SUN039]
MRLVITTLALFAVFPAQAAPPRIDPGPPCILTSATPLDPGALFERPERFDCARGTAHVSAPHSWGLVRNLKLTSDPTDPWELRHEYSQADAEAIYVRYADGRVAQAPSDRASARRYFSPGMVSYALPPGRGTITDILIRADNLRNQRGIAPGMELKTGRAALEGDLLVLWLYGLLGGIVGALLIYNFALFVALRYTFILCYCLGAVAMLGMGLSWSGGIFLLFPNLDTTEQISLTMLGTLGVLAAGVLFLRSFVEPDRLPQRLWAATMAAAVVGLGSCVMRLVDSRFAWEAMDRISYWSMVAVLVGLIATAATATLRGSRSGRIYLLAWSAPILAGIARSVWAMGLVGGTSVVIAMGPLMLMAIEALMSALAVSWRVGQLRTERDEARASHSKLREVADTDALTGLLNRRAFIDHALGVRARPPRERLLVIDIDEFKRINDRHGHQAGDDVLVAVAAAIRETAPPEAVIGRLGGEEFALLLPAEPVDALPERLCRAVEAAVTPAGHSVTISVGVADGVIADDASWRLIYYAADQALYRSKNGGRNRVSHAPHTLAA